MKAYYPCSHCSVRFETHDALNTRVVAEHGADPLPKPPGFGQPHDKWSVV
jgi:hypothetical protein